MNTLRTDEERNGGKGLKPSGLRQSHNRGGKEHTTEYTSKNLDAERRRRARLHDRLMALRSLVPNITNMNKATIIEDAMDYIKELQLKVKSLSDQLLEMEASEPEEPVQVNKTPPEKMMNCEIQEDVQVSNIGANKFWIKIIVAKKKGVFTRFVEEMSFLGFNIDDIGFSSTSDGAILFTASVEGAYDDDSSPGAKQMRDLVVETLRST